MAFPCFPSHSPLSISSLFLPILSRLYAFSLNLSIHISLSLLLSFPLSALHYSLYTHTISLPPSRPSLSLHPSLSLLLPISLLSLPSLSLPPSLSLSPSSFSLLSLSPVLSLTFSLPPSPFLPHTLFK